VLAERRNDARHMSIDVIVPNLNGGRYLAATLRSIAENDGTRAIVVDGGSTDGSRELAERSPGTVVVLDRTPGLSRAVNLGIEHSTAPLLMWLGADDRLIHGASTRVERAMLTRPDAMWGYGSVRFIDADDRTLGCRAARWHGFGALLLRDYIATPGVFFRRAALDAVGRFDEGLSLAMDYDMWVRLAREWPPVIIPELVGEYRVHSSTLSQRLSARQVGETYVVARRNATTFGQGLRVHAYHWLRAVRWRYLPAPRQGDWTPC